MEGQAYLAIKMQKISLTKGLITIVDDEDFIALSVFKWCVTNRMGKFYAVRRPPGQRGGNLIAMHRWIMKAPKGLDVDHINGDSLDNRRTNLRVCTHRDNLRNRRGPTRISTTGIRGVGWDKSRNKFTVKLKLGDRTKFLGRFDELSLATKTANEARVKYFGEYAGVLS